MEEVQEMTRMTADEMRESWPTLLDHLDKTFHQTCNNDVQLLTRMLSVYASAFLFQFIEIAAQLSEMQDVLRKIAAGDDQRQK